MPDAMSDLLLDPKAIGRRHHSCMAKAHERLKDLDICAEMAVLLVACHSKVQIEGEDQYLATTTKNGNSTSLPSRFNVNVNPTLVSTVLNTHLHIRSISSRSNP